MESVAKTNKLVLATFLDELSNFIDLVCSLLPTNKEMESNKAYFITCKKVNPRIVLISWYSDIACLFGKEVENGDLTFFATHDYMNDDRLKSYSTFIVKLFENMKSNILGLKQTDKDLIMQYIQNISKISSLYKQ